MKTVLTSEQLEEIKTFIRKRGFKEADLQYEILDHMACRVEEKMSAQPSLDFHDAVRSAHQDFGVLGFSVVEDAMRESLGKQYWGQVKQEFVRWFGSPWILAVAGSGTLGFYAYRLLPVFWLLAGVTVLYLLAIVWISVAQYRAFKKYRNTLINKTALFYTTLIPITYFQIWSRLTADATTQTGASQHPLFALVFVLLVLAYAFALVSGRRIMQYALARCTSFEQQYGPLSK